MLYGFGTDCFSTDTVLHVALISFLTGTICGYILFLLLLAGGVMTHSSKRNNNESDNDSTTNTNTHPTDDEKFENCLEEELENDKENKKKKKKVCVVSFECGRDGQTAEVEQEEAAAEANINTFSCSSEKKTVLDGTFENCLPNYSVKELAENNEDNNNQKTDTRVVSLELAEQATEAVSAVLEEFTLQLLVDNDDENKKAVPKFEFEQLNIGKLLMKGKFCNVYEVIKINNRNYDNNDDDAESQSHQNNYAVKYLHKTTMSDRSMFKSGAIELAVEAKLLSNINHPNIVNIHGISDNGLLTTGITSTTGTTLGCQFLLLDRFDCTLDEKIYRSWKVKQKELRKRRTTGTFNKMFAPSSSAKDDKKNERREFFIHRLNVALNIAIALEHLHSLNIVHRDIQPGNIGFDSRGTVKIFNLGLARELHPNDHNKGKLCKIKGSVGHIRYMAPEMALNRPYNLLADVYSFTILLWEIISIKKPFEGMTKHAYSLLVLKNSERPPIDLSWSFRIRSLLKTGWSKRTKERPKMASICKDLDKEIQKRLSDSSSSIRSTSSNSVLSSRRPSFGSSQASLILLEDDLYSSMEIENNMNGSSESFLSERDGRIHHNIMAE